MAGGSVGSSQTSELLTLADLTHEGYLGSPEQLSLHSAPDRHG